MTGMGWASLMRAGLHDLRLQPRDFWALTPAELALMLGVGPQTRPLGRGRLDELIAAFPDLSKG
mgnify:FL=1